MCVCFVALASGEMSIRSIVFDELCDCQCDRFPWRVSLLDDLMLIDMRDMIYKVGIEGIMDVFLFCDSDPRQRQHVRICPAGVMDRQVIVFTIRQSSEVKPGTIGLSLTQRKFATASIGQDMDVYPYEFDRATSCCASLLLEVDFLQKKQYVVLNFIYY